MIQATPLTSLKKDQSQFVFGPKKKADEDFQEEELPILIKPDPGKKRKAALSKKAERNRNGNEHHPPAYQPERSECKFINIFKNFCFHWMI